MRLTDGTLIEFWGMPQDPTYAAKMIEKRYLAQRLGLSVIEVLPEDLTRLQKVFHEQLG